ncbi:hypothetical protein CE91St25_15480 [Campylobacter ureolyticus]|uniref:hypothetical protein n=1 Tax=Campylobacter ureolyticus TaxID=827 RepID=UPI001FC8DC8F|nr:hypothetical protein [Campylobacter ureolyticus]GKH61212.1 hypothetical protein CE91St25_15480 [Campylobacter ureolyticus]
MYFVETITASLIFKCNKNTLRQSVKRNSPKYPFIKVDANTRSRGGKRLLFKVGALKIKEAIGKNIISTDIKIWDEKLNLVSVDEILSGGCDDNLGDDSLGGGELGGGGDDAMRSGALRGLSGVLSDARLNDSHLNLEPLSPDKKALNLDDMAKESKDEKNNTLPTPRDAVVSRNYTNDTRASFDCSKPCNKHNKKIKELEKMNKIKAINEMNAVPNGLGKTAWGKAVAQKYGVSLKTLYSWKKDLEDERGSFNGVNKSINFKVRFKTSSFDINALEWALASWINNPLTSKTFIYEALRKEALKNSWNIGSYKSFARQMDKPEVKAMLLKATRGVRGVRNEIAPFVLRDLNLYKSMEMICGDQIVFDFDTINEQGEVVNPNAYVWIDMGSGAIIGVDVVLGKYNKLSVGRSLKMALGFGVPDAIYTDNGKPELSNYVKEVISQLSGIKLKDFNALDPRLTHKKARPANSRAKPIENIFNHVQRWMMESIIYEKGGSSYHKDNRKNSELLKKYMKNNPLDYKEFIGFFARAIKKWNEHLNKSRNIVPMDKFIKGLKGVSTFDKTTLDYIFSERRTIKVRNSSINLSINKAKYSFTSGVLSKYNKEVVEVRLIDEELKSVSVVDIDKHSFICEAYINKAIDPRDERLVKAKISENEKVVKAVNEAFNYYKGLYTKTIRLNTYTSVANQSKKKTEKNKKLRKKFAMSNDKLLEAM